MTRLFDGPPAARRAELSRRDFAKLSMAALLTLAGGRAFRAEGAAARLDKSGTAALAKAMRANIDRGLAAGFFPNFWDNRGWGSRSSRTLPILPRRGGSVGTVATAPPPIPTPPGRWAAS